MIDLSSDHEAMTPSAVRAAAEAVKVAIDAHLRAVEHRNGDNDPQVQIAYDALAAAAEAYDDALFAAYEEVTPFGSDDDDDDDDIDEDDLDLDWDDDSDDDSDDSDDDGDDDDH